MKILLSALACEPNRGTEEGIGWNTARELAKYHQVWVFTRTIYRLAIEAELACNPVPNLHFVYFDPLGWINDWKRQQWGLQLHYYLWQVWAYFIALPLNRDICFDLICHVTYAKYWSPSFLAMLPVPFIWGPVGGGESAPTAFRKDFSFRGKNYEFLRDLIRWVGERDPFVLLTAQKSTVALAQTEDTAQRLRSLRVKEVQVFSNTGLPKEDISLLAQCGVPEEGVVRFISMGRLIDWKGFHLGLRAFALLKIERAEYWIMGDGYARKRLEALARKLGVEKKVRFWGNLPHQEMLSKLRECHLLVHASLHDSGGGVCAEMMAAGRPVICLDLGGPATQVTEDTGIKVPAYNPEQVVRDLADAMTRLACDPELRARMGEAGRMRVSDLFNWDVKGKFFAQLYEEILDREKSSDSPSQ